MVAERLRRPGRVPQQRERVAGGRDGEARGALPLVATLLLPIVLVNTLGFLVPVFNLARLEFDAGNLAEARRLWVRYLELDAESEWARIAQKGIQFVDLHMARTAG